MAIAKKEVAYTIDIPWNQLQADPRIDKISPYERLYVFGVNETIAKNEAFQILYCDKEDSMMEMYEKALQKFHVSVSDFWMTKKDFKKLQRMEIKFWAKKKGLPQNYIKKQYMAMHNLQLAPAEFLRKPRWAEYGKVYIKQFGRKDG